MRLQKYILVVAVLFSTLLPTIALAQDDGTTPDVITIEKATVLQMTDQHWTTIPGTDTPSEIQTLKARVLDGADKGQVVTFDNNFTQLNVGDTFYIRHDRTNDGIDYWTVSDAYRLNVLIGLGLVFLLLIFVFGGIQGIRGLASLAGSLILIFYVLLPGILHGYSPIFISIGVSSLIIIAGSYITHGFNKTTSAAVIGMLLTVIVTGLGAYYVIHIGHFSGYSSEESVYLNFDTHGNISMIALLFGGIMIGLLGVLYDIAIGQAIAVEELFRAGTHMNRLQIYRRAIRIGREHIGALVNTLAIAYVGVALPLLLLFKETYSSANASVGSIINGELFSTEIVRMLVGGIGLILAVPITTLIATYMLSKVKESSSPSGHSHSHH